MPLVAVLGMVMMIEPIDRCITDLRSKRSYDEVIYLTPDGMMLDQPLSNKLSLHKNLIMLCGHYKGIDERIREHLITCEISIGNYVLSGGELPAAVLCDSIVRLLPGVLNDETSALSDSFQDNLLACLYIPDRQFIKDGKFRRYFCREMSGRLTSGDMNTALNVHKNEDLIC